MLDHFDAMADSNYARLRTPGFIQGHGALLTLHPRTLRVLSASDNSSAVIGTVHADLLGRVFTDLVGPSDSAAEIKDAAADEVPNFINPLPLEIGGRKFDGIFHFNDGVIFAELEPRAPGRPTRADMDRLSDETIAGMMVPDSFDSLIETGPRVIRDATGFDRVMLYRFDAAYRGQVIAEAKRDGIESYMNLFFPERDIGLPARQLYEQNFSRYIPRTDGHTARLSPPENPLNGRALDMSNAQLRGVAPCHTEYLLNMGVVASMSFSILSEGKLWGLFACHHYAPADLSYVQRLVCEQVAMLFVAKLEDLLNPAAQAEEMEKRRDAVFAGSPVIAADPLSQSWTEAQEAALLHLVDADGAAIYWDGKVGQIGTCPDFSDLHQYITNQPDAFSRLVRMYDDQGLFYTNAIASVLPFGAKMREKGSGVLVVPLSNHGHKYLLWFRPELVVKATWGGNPSEGHGANPNARATPRKSFAAWKEDIRDQSAPWTSLQIANATALRDHILRKAAGP
jgi:light-regulated signal transduction histidine kinase (bacteriophytochrome)